MFHGLYGQKTENYMKRILIIEDDEKIAKALELRIRNAGYQTAVASDGYAGVSAVPKTNPDLVLLDINMPAGNGFTVAERIRSISPKPMPIVFITASKKPEFFDRALALGASGYIEKPYNSAQVLALLENVLKHQPNVSAESSHPTR